MSKTLSHATPCPWGAPLVLSLLWGGLFLLLQPEWEINAQYSYGYLVPFIALYLFYLRSEDAPPFKPIAHAPLRFTLAGTLLVALLLLIPIAIVGKANPEWRLLYWAYALTVFGTSQLYLIRSGGWAITRHYLAPFTLLLLSVPWPSGIEQELVQGLMRLVTKSTVEVVNFCGIQAVEQGNVIRLAHMPIGVEEACSGVRSFQSTIMAAFFFGEMYRFRWALRAALFAVAIPMAIVVNLLRTLTLTYAGISGGAQQLESWHDPVGHVAAILSFVITLLLALLLRRLFDNRPPPPAQPFALKLPSPSLGETLCATTLLVLAPLCAYFWFPASDPTKQTHLEIDWNQGAKTVRFEPISEATRAILRYTEGQQALWRDDDGARWTVFSFTWNKGSVSSFAGVHRPDACLPSSGFRFVKTEAPLVWTTPEGRTLTFESQIFATRNGELTHVFFGVWDDSANAPTLARTTSERLRQAWEHKRVGNRQQLEIILQNVPSHEAARTRILNWLPRAATCVGR